MQHMHAHAPGQTVNRALIHTWYRTHATEWLLSASCGGVVSLVGRVHAMATPRWGCSWRRRNYAFLHARRPWHPHRAPLPSSRTVSVHARGGVPQVWLRVVATTHSHPRDTVCPTRLGWCVVATRVLPCACAFGCVPVQKTGGTRHAAGGTWPHC